MYFQGALIECHPVKATFNMCETADVNDTMYTIRTEFCSNGGYFEVDGFGQIYDSQEEFNKGVKTTMLIPICFNNKSKKKNSEMLCYKLLGYTFSDLKYWIDDKSKEHDPFVEKTLPMKKFWLDYNTLQWHNDAVPKCDYYPTRNDAINWGEYKLNHADGTSKKIVGKNKLIQLDEEQKKLVNDFVQLMDKMKENGILLQMDMECNLYAYNVKNIKISLVSLNIC